MLIQFATLPYVEPHQTPLYWRDEQSGVLAAAVETFINYEGGASIKPLTDEQFALLRAYLEYVIKAPCWKADDEQTLLYLRHAVSRIKNSESLSVWLQDCLKLGIDPL